MSLAQFTSPRWQFFDTNGDPLSGGTIETYEPGTSTAKTAYQDRDGTTAHTAAIELDSRGSAVIYLDGEYKIVLKDADGVTVATDDYVSGSVTDTEISGLVTINFTSDADLTLTTAQSRYRVIDLTDTGTTLTTGRNVIVPTVTRVYTIDNNTAQTLTVKTSAGTGVALSAGDRAQLYCDGTNVDWQVNSASLGNAAITGGSVTGITDLALADGGTGASTAAGARTNLEVEAETRTAPQATTHDFTADADYTLTSAQELYGRIVLTDTTPNLTTGRNVIVSTTERRYIISNETAQTLTVKTSAGTGVPVAAGTERVVYCDGTNVERLTYPVLDEDDMASDSDEAVSTQQAGKAYADGLVANMVDAVTDGDTLTWHEVSVQSVASGAYATVFDLASATELVGGILLGASVGFRLTIDGTVTVNRTTAINGRDGGTNVYGGVSLPAAKGASSMKLEVYNAAASSVDYGWRVATR